jgi:hypothetical protein
MIILLWPGEFTLCCDAVSNTAFKHCPRVAQNPLEPGAISLDNCFGVVSPLHCPATFISRTIRRWTLHHSSDKSLPNLAEMYNPCIQGWINYYGNFYRTQLRSTLKRIDLYVIRWARRKFKRLRRNQRSARLV